MLEYQKDQVYQNQLVPESNTNNEDHTIYFTKTHLSITKESTTKTSPSIKQ